MKSKVKNSLTDELLSTGPTGLFPQLSPDLPAEGFSPGALWSDKKGSQHIIQHQVYMPLPWHQQNIQKKTESPSIGEHGGWEKRSQNSQVEGTVVGKALNEFQRADAWKSASAMVSLSLK